MKQVEDPAQIDPERLQEVLHEELLQEKVLAWLEEANTVELVPEGSLPPAESETDETAATDEVESSEAEAETVTAEDSTATAKDSEEE
jgi:trigger factor